jgi:hypothetical protein
LRGALLRGCCFLENRTRIHLNIPYFVRDVATLKTQLE